MKFGIQAWRPKGLSRKSNPGMGEFGMLLLFVLIAVAGGIGVTWAMAKPAVTTRVTSWKNRAMLQALVALGIGGLLATKNSALGAAVAAGLMVNPVENFWAMYRLNSGTGAATGNLTVTVPTTGATVAVDGGAAQSVSGGSITLPLSVGSHSIVIAAPGRTSVTRSVNVAASGSALTLADTDLAVAAGGGVGRRYPVAV